MITEERIAELRALWRNTSRLTECDIAGLFEWIEAAMKREKDFVETIHQLDKEIIELGYQIR